MAGGAGSFEDDDSGRMITDINVTPLVDIVLVLLITGLHEILLRRLERRVAAYREGA